jgi:hypothetical protein
LQRPDAGFVTIVPYHEGRYCPAAPTLAVAEERAIGAAAMQRVEKAGVWRHHTEIELGRDHRRRHQCAIRF